MKIHYSNGVTIVKESDGYWVQVATGQGGLDYDSYPQNEHGDPTGFLPTLAEAEVEADRVAGLDVAYKQ